MTGREVEILHLAGEGHSNTAIGRAVGVAENTVAADLMRLRRKLGARDRAYAALNRHQAERESAPDDSPYARLYDEVAEALT